LLSYILFRPLNEALRRSQHRPYLTTILVGLFDALTLIAIVAGLYHANDFSWMTAQDAALQLFALQSLTSLVGHPSKVIALAAVMGVAYDAAILKTGMSAAEFRRSDADLASIAEAHLMNGQLDEARSWIARQQTRSEKGVAVAASIDIALGNFGRALDLLRVRKAMIAGDGSDEVVFLDLVAKGNLVLPTPEARANLLNFLIDRRAADVAVALFLSIGYESPMERNSLIATLEARCTERDYPVTIASIEILGHNWGPALRILREARPGSIAAEVIRQLCICQLTVSAVTGTSQEQPGSLSDWELREWPEVETLVSELSSDLAPIVLPWFLSTVELVKPVNFALASKLQAVIDDLYCTAGKSDRYWEGIGRRLDALATMGRV